MFDGRRILLICDDEEVSRPLREQLTFGDKLFVSSEPNPESGLELFKQNSFDLVIVTFSKIDLNATDFIAGLKKTDPDCVIVVFLKDLSPEILNALPKLGIYDYISKPINAERLSFLVKKGMELHSLMFANHRLIYGLKESNAALEKQNVLLVGRIEESTKNLTRLYEDLRSTYMRTIKVLAQVIDARDHYTHSHSENVARYSVVIAEEMGLSAKETETVREACELHDLGKIGIEDNILSKAGSLNAQEWEQIKRHPLIAVQILEPLTFLNDVIELIRQHHEHYDGRGYPEGRRGEDILLGARIIHLADAYESMRSARSYRKIPLTKEETILEIKRNTGTQFDPSAVEAFFKIVDKLE